MDGDRDWIKTFHCIPFHVFLFLNNVNILAAKLLILKISTLKKNVNFNKLSSKQIVIP